MNGFVIIQLGILKPTPAVSVLIIALMENVLDVFQAEVIAVTIFSVVVEHIALVLLARVQVLVVEEDVQPYSFMMAKTMLKKESLGFILKVMS